MDYGTNGQNAGFEKENHKIVTFGLAFLILLNKVFLLNCFFALIFILILINLFKYLIVNLRFFFF